jgi:hypothetical protein
MAAEPHLEVRPDTLPPDRWIEAFMAHLLREVPQVSMVRLAAKAAELQTRLGQFDPVEVAEAEWNDLRLDDGSKPDEGSQPAPSG